MVGFCSLQVRRSLKIRGRRKEKEKLPSGITADYSANFFAHLDLDRDVERDRGVEEVMADANATIDNNGDAGDHVMSINVSHSDSSETSLQSVGVNKVKIIVFVHRIVFIEQMLCVCLCDCDEMMNSNDKV